MKSYEEMTRSVLYRAEEERKARKRRSIKLTALAAGICLAALAVFAGNMLQEPDGTAEPWKPRVSMFCVTAGASEQRQVMMKGEQTPVGAQLFVRDIEGLSSQELLNLRIADEEHAKQMLAHGNEELSWGPNWATTAWCSEKTMVTTVFAGSFTLSVEDYSQIKDVSISTTEIGYTSQYGTDLYDTSKKDGVGFTWCLSQAGFKMLEEEPQMPLSQLKDTVTVTVEFADGTKEVAVVDISVDDEGLIYGTFQEIYPIG